MPRKRNDKRSIARSASGYLAGAEGALLDASAALSAGDLQRSAQGLIQTAYWLGRAREASTLSGDLLAPTERKRLADLEKNMSTWSRTLASYGRGA